MSTDAITVLKADHTEIKGLFREFEAASDGAHAVKGRLVDRMIKLLTIHTYLENEIMYPAVRTALPDLEADVLESYEEHHVADVLCMELAAMSPDAERFDAKVTVLIENVRHHVDEEEKDWFPKVRTGLSRSELSAIGARMLEAKKSAPQSPASPSALKKVLDAVVR
jgi:hypothetical protein